MAAGGFVEVKGTRKLRVPLRPNYIFSTSGEQHAIGELSDDDLFAVGMAWTRMLQDDARAKRKRGAKS